jgi:hypothetical protein
MEEDNMKHCSKCKIDKEEIDFYKRKTRGGHHSYCKLCLLKIQTDRWKARKLAAVNLFGGKCTKCGYCKNLASLDFHHLDPNTKEYIWSTLSKRPWNEVISELKKCTLLCKNCHGELHNPEMQLDIVSSSSANKNLDKDRVRTIRLNSIIKTGSCPICNIEVYGTKYCSIECANKSQRRVSRPSKEQLCEDIKQENWSALGRKYGVSDNAVRKWARSYKLVQKMRWIS